jgi:biotin transport system substrate-specific component
MLSQVAYVAAGASGLPVFAYGNGGIHYLMSPRAGYIFSFILVAWVAGALAERGWDRHPLKLVATLTLGNLLMLGLGALWLGNFIGLQKAFQVGFLPFILTNAIQSAFAVILLPVAWKFVRE